MLIAQEIKSEIENTIGALRYESGGLIGSSDGRVIDNFYFDLECNGSINEYLPNVRSLQCVLKEWHVNNIVFLGVIHSHAFDSKLSDKDVLMARKIIETNEQIDSLLMPVFTLKNQRITWYKVSMNYIIGLKVETLKSNKKKEE